MISSGPWIRILSLIEETDMQKKNHFKEEYRKPNKIESLEKKFLDNIDMVSRSLRLV